MLVAAVMIAACGLFVALFATRPADCGRVGVRPSDWTAEGVVVEAAGTCPLRDGDLVTAVDGRSLTDADTEAQPAATPTAGGTVDFTVLRADRRLTVSVDLARPDVLLTLLAAWPAMLFVGSLMAVAGFVWWRRADATTGALLVFAAGLGTSTVPTLLGLPTVGVTDRLLTGLYLGLTQVAYLTAWAGGLAFALLFPRPFRRLADRPAATAVLGAAPLWVTGAWAALVAPGSGNRLEWVGLTIRGGALVVVATLLAYTGVSVAQFRGSRDALERQQMRWLAGTGTLAISAGLAGWFLPQVLLGESLPTAWIGLAALPFVVGLGVAVTRHRLFDLEIVLNRGLLYGLLTTSVVSIYLVVVSVAGAVMRGGSTTPASIVATAVVAVAVNPLRVALQKAVSRLMYGDRDDPYLALSRLGRRLDATGGADLLPAIADDVADALRAPYVAIEVPALERRVEAGTRPRWLGDGQLVDVPLVDRGERIGTLRLAPRASGAAYGGADRRLLEDLARQVGAAARELSLRTDLQRSRERIVLAREEERRRLRRALHDELGPAIAGLGLRTEAARRLVAADPDRAAAALADVREGTTSLVGDVRRLAYDLRPPALDELGLAGALRQHVGDLDTPQVTVSTSGDLGALPAAVETAAYRIAVEAVVNTVRHARASSCKVHLGVQDSRLEVRVVDDGVGLPPDVGAGVGITAMRERAAELGGHVEVEPGSRGGTTVVAALPLAGGAA